MADNPDVLPGSEPVPPPPVPTARNELRRGVVSLPQTIAQSLSTMAPAMSGAFITYLAAIKAGGATPLSFLLAMIACLFIGGVVGQFALHLPSAGSLYTYTCRGLGSFWGFVTGWGYAFGFAWAGVAVLAGGGAYIGLVMANLGAPSVLQKWWLWFALGIILYFLLSYYDIRFSTRSELVFAALTSATLLLLAAIIVGKGGAHGNTIKAFSPSAAGVSWTLVIGGLTFAILSFTGFETAAVLAEETSNPRRNVPFAVIGAVIAGGLFYIFVTYATSIGYGVRAATTLWPKSAGGLQPLATEYAPYLVNWVLLAGGLSAIFCGLGVHNMVSRTMFAMGREGVLPRALGKTHPKHRTPYIAIMAYLGIIVLFTVVTILLTTPATRAALGGGANQFTNGFYVFTFGLTIAAPPIMIGYCLLCIAGMSFGARGGDDRRANPRHVVLSALGLVAAGAAVFGSLYYSFVAVAPGATVPVPYAVIPWIVLAWLVIGAGVALILRGRRPEAWREMGGIFE